MLVKMSIFYSEQGSLGTFCANQNSAGASTLAFGSSALLRRGMSTMLCGRRRRSTTTGSPALNNRTPFLPRPTLPQQLGTRKTPLSFRIELPIMPFGRHRRSTTPRSPALNNSPSFLAHPTLPPTVGTEKIPQFLACPTLPPKVGPKGTPNVDQNLVAHHAVRSGSTLHLHREPCSEQQAKFLACPTLPPTVGPKGTPHCRSEFGCPSCCAVGVDAALPQATTEQQAQFLACPTLPPTVGPKKTPHCRSEYRCPSCCGVGVDAAPPQGALLRTTRTVFGLPYPPPYSWAQGNSPLSIRSWFTIMLCGRGRRCTSTRSPAQNNRPSFLTCPALPPTVGPKGTLHSRSEFGCPSCCAVGVDAPPPQRALLRTTGLIFCLPYPSPYSWAQENTPLSIRIWLPTMPWGRNRRCTSTGSPAQNNRPSFWPALPSPHSWAQENPPLTITIWFSIMLCRWSLRCTSTGSPAQKERPSFWPPLPSPHSWAQGNPHCRSEFGCPSRCAVGLDAAPPQGALLRMTRPVFGLPYPPPRTWAQGNPLFSIRIWLPIMLCGRARRWTSTGSPVRNNRPSF